MKNTIVIVAFLLSLCGCAQGQPRDTSFSHLELAAQLGINDLWSPDAIAALEQEDRFNKMIDMGSGVAMMGSMDMHGYARCMDSFVKATTEAQKLFGDKQVLKHKVKNPDGLYGMIDPVGMEEAIFDGTGHIDVIWMYELNGTQQLLISLACDSEQRCFVMAIREL